MKTTRVVSALLAALLLAGPFVTLAVAQQPTQPAPPAAQPPAPDLFQETLRTQPPARSHGVYDAAAVVTNVFLVPGRALTCLVGGVLGVAVLAGTLGTGYHPASAVVHEGCGGKWTVTGEDLQPETASGRPTNLYMEQR
ncbi:MAG TPA: hypothetical protein VFL90_16390 [Methylomirabilota bacterium]|nr:hypothetical protein [Methylomirabilota bacterium]